ncbi:MAG: alpha-xylosidase [candidate division KSB1 bacterium]|nr:alpha-xylosidase [candidate division KSB1 bacterium]
MPISEEHKKYLQYHVRPQRIFDQEKFQYEYLYGLTSWQRQGSSLSLRCLTNEEHPVTVEVLFCTASMFRFRLAKELPPKTGGEREETFMVVKREWPEFNFEVQETAEKLTIDTGQIRLVLHKEPWRMQVFDAEGYPVFSQNTYGPNRSYYPTFPIGFRKEGEKPAGCYESLDLRPAECLYGLGEKYGPLNKVGLHSVSWQTDATLTVSDRAYKNIPFFMSTAGYGLFINTSRRIDYELGSECYVCCSFLVSGEEMEYYFIYGPEFKEIIQQYTELTGRSPMPPKWSFGLWMSRFSYKSRQELETVCQELRKHEVPCDVVHLDPNWMRPKHYCDFQWDEAAFPEHAEMIQKLHEQGFKLSLWEQPYVPATTEMFQEGKDRGYFVKDKNGEVYLQAVFDNNPSAFVDFTNPEACQWYKEKHKKLLAEGVNAFKTDMGEAIPEDAVFWNGMSGAEGHNLYPLLYQKTVFEAAQEFSPGNGLLWARSAYAGSQRYPLHWSGDSHSTFEDLACNLRAGLSYGLSGVPFWSHDIGGFQGPPPTVELYVRWAQLGLLCSHARCHGSGPREPWHFGPEALRIFKKYATLRYQLLPYLWSYAFEATQTGLPVLRPLVLEYQEDPNTYHCDLQYLLGSELLIVPVFNTEGRVNVYLPEGKWLDFWTNRVFLGPYNLDLEVDLETLPIFIREDSIIPFGPAMNYVGEKPLDPLTLDIFVEGEARFSLYDEPQVIELVAKSEKKSLQIELGAMERRVMIKVRRAAMPKEVLVTGSRVTPVSSQEKFDTTEEAWWRDRETQTLWIKIKLEGQPETIEIRN